ncbi:MAG: cell division protein (septum formation) [uncultured bacterium]|nr:MAG: cell division protein (septum formation) [uncultured bacterium]
MLNLPFLTLAKNQNKFLVVDINSKSVICLAIYVDVQNNAKIIGLGNSPLEEKAVSSGNIIDFDQVTEALKQAVVKATTDSGEKIKQVIFGVSGDLALGLVTTAKAGRSQSTVISEQEIKQVQQTILENAIIQARNEILETTGNSDIEIEPITTSNIYTKVNGRFIANPIGVEGESVEIAMFTAFTPSYHTKTLQKLARKVGLNILAIASEMYALTTSIRPGAPTLADYVVINIGSDFTDVAVVFGNGIVATKCLCIGADHFTKEISLKMGLTFNEAEKMKASYTYEKLAQSESLVVQNCMHETLETWLDGLELLFEEFSGVKTFASNIFLVGEGSKLPDIYDFVSREPWTKSIAFKAPPEFNKLKLDNMTKISDSTGQADQAEYLLPSALASIYLEMNSQG